MTDRVRVSAAHASDAPAMPSWVGEDSVTYAQAGVDTAEGARAVDAIKEAYDAGQRMFGENHIQEMAAKAAILPKDIEWHFTGHVQTNKIKYMAPFVSLIHAVDSFRLLREIDKHAARNNRTIDCLLQIHIAQEETKYGLTKDECRQLLANEPWRELQHVRIVGLMAMEAIRMTQCRYVVNFIR